MGKGFPKPYDALRAPTHDCASGSAVRPGSLARDEHPPFSLHNGGHGVCLLGPSLQPYLLDPQGHRAGGWGGGV